MREKIIIAACALLAGIAGVSLYCELMRETQQDVVLLPLIDSKITSQGLFARDKCFGTLSNVLKVISSEESQLDMNGEILLPIIGQVSFRGILSINGLKQVGASEFSAYARNQSFIFGTIGVNPIHFIFKHDGFKREGELPGPIMLSGSRTPYNLIAPFKRTMNGAEGILSLKPIEECRDVSPLEVDISILKGSRE